MDEPENNIGLPRYDGSIGTPNREPVDALLRGYSAALEDALSAEQGFVVRVHRSQCATCCGTGYVTSVAPKGDAFVARFGDCPTCVSYHRR